MTMIAVLLALLGTLTLGRADEVQQKPFSFEITEFSPYIRSISMSDGVFIEEDYVTLTAGEEGTEFCKKLVCMGKLYYGRSAKVPIEKAVTFHTSFSFSMRKSRPDSVSGDGFVFFLTAHPQFSQGQPNGMFGLFTEIQELADANPMFGVEFDTMRNFELLDDNDNHVGVNINSAVSVRTASADSVNVQLNDGERIIAWIDYDKALNVVETRISYDSPNVVKPADALLSYKYDINEMRLHQFFVGFSASSNFGFEQSHQIHSWSFGANFDSAAPALKDTGIPWTRLIAYSVGGTVAAGIGWFCVVRYTAWGKAIHARCMKLVPKRILTLMSCSKRKTEEAAVEEGGKPGTKAPPPKTTNIAKPAKTVNAPGLKALAAPATAADDDEDEDDEEDVSPPRPPLRPVAKPPPPPKEDEDEDEHEEDDDDDDDDSDDDDLPPPPPPLGGMRPRPKPFMYPPPHPPHPSF